MLCPDDCRPEHLDDWVRLPGEALEAGLFDVAGCEAVLFDATDCYFLSTIAVAGLIRTARQCRVWLRVRPGAVRDKLTRILGPYVFRQDPALLDFWQVFPGADHA